MAQIIILEGLNRTGKSSVAKYLNEQKNYSLFKDMTPYLIKDYSLREQQQIINMITYNTLQFALTLPNETKIVLDRFHISNHVFSRLYRGTGDTNFKEYDNMLRSHHAKIIYMVDDLKNISERCNKDIEDVSTFAELFDNTMNRSRLDKLQINYNNPELNNIIDEFIF